MNDNTKELGTKSIGKLIAQYSIPSVIAMVVNAIYNVVDRIFIGNFAGEDALAGLTIAFPVMMIIFAFASLVGAGGSALISIRLGEKDVRGASHVFGNSLGLGVLITAISLVLIFLNLNGILLLFGATTDILPYATDYMTIILCGFIFQMLSMTMNNTVRSEGNPILPMAAMMSSALTNMILDYIFIVILGMGVEGAALATILGQFTGLVLLLSFYIRKKSQLQLRPRDFIPEPRISLNIFTIGFATFIGTLGNSLAMTFVNRALGKYGGTEAITAMGAINSLFTLVIMPIMGIQMGIQPIIGYNHGAGQQSRVYRTLRDGIAIGIVFASLVYGAMLIFPRAMVSLFMDSASPTVDVTVRGMRIYLLILPLISVNAIGIAFFQATNRGRTSLWMSMLRQFLFLIPLVLILPRFFGLTGVWSSAPIADGLSILITLLVLVGDYRKNSTTDTNRSGELRKAVNR